MQLIPESIATRKTIAMDETWELRLALLRYSQLKIDFQNETNIDKLQLWLEMFGGTIDETVINTFTIDEYRRLLQSIILLFKLSGTVKSIQLLGYVLGVTITVYKATITYNSEIDYNGMYRFDSGNEYSNFSLRLVISDYPVTFDFDLFHLKFKLLFRIFEPVWIFPKLIFINNSYFTYKFPIILQ